MKEEHILSDSRTAEQNELEKQALNNTLIEMKDRATEYQDKIKQLQSELAHKKGTELTRQDEQIINRTYEAQIEEQNILKQRKVLEKEREQRLSIDRTKKRHLEPSVRVSLFCICFYDELKCSLCLPGSEKNFASTAQL